MRHKSHLLIGLVTAIFLGAGAVPAIAAPGVPVITSPSPSQSLCGAQVTMAGTSDPGDHVEIVDAGTEAWVATFVARETHWTGTITLVQGSHSIKVRAINPSNNTYSDYSATRTFTVDADGMISGVNVAPASFSPMVPDGVKDTTTMTVNVLKPGRIVLFKVMYGNDVVSRSAGMQATVGKKSWTWNGKTMAGAWASNRRFLVVVEWSKPGCTIDTSFGVVTVDNVAPIISIVSVGPYNNAIYPVTDGYRDTLEIKFATNEPANVVMKIFPKGSQKILRQFSAAYSTPTTRIFVWNGRGADGKIVPRGLYEYQFWASDFLGNKRHPATARDVITVSHGKLVWRTWSATKAGGDARVLSTSTEDWCYLDYRYGGSLSLWSQDCSDYYSPFDSVAAIYNFYAPGATRYGTLTVSVEGKSDYSDPLYGFVEHWPNDSLVSLGAFGGSSDGWRSYPGRSASGHVGSRGLLQVFLAVSGQSAWRGEAEYDISRVKVTLSYAVLT
jgi:flagellar hook assembly protein FlgD